MRTPADNTRHVRGATFAPPPVVLSFAVLLLGIAAPLARAQDAPEWLEAVRVERLDNGLTLVLAPDESVPHVSVELWLPTGLREDPPGRRGLSHLFEHVLANTRLSLDTAGLRRARPRFADSNAQVRRDYARYFLLVDPGAVDAGLALHAARLRLDVNAITDSVVAGHRQVVLNEQRNHAARGPDVEGLLRTVYRQEHPYALPDETEESVHAVNAGMLREYLRTRTAPDGALVLVVGRFDPDWVARRARAHFAPLEPAPTSTSHVVRWVPNPTPLAEHVVYRADSSAALHWRFVLPPLGSSALDVAEVALRLAAARVGDVLPAATRWRFDRVPGSLGSDLSLVASLGQDADPARAARSLDEALQLLADGVVSDSGLVAAREATILGTLSGMDRLGFYDSRSEQLGEAVFLAGDPAELTRRFARVNGVSADAVADVAREWLVQRGVRVLEHPRPRWHASAGVLPAPIALHDAEPFAPGAVVDTTVRGVRVVVAVTRHNPLVRATVAEHGEASSTTLHPRDLGSWLGALRHTSRDLAASSVFVVGDVDPSQVVAGISEAARGRPIGAPAATRPVTPRGADDIAPVVPGDSSVAEPGRVQARIIAEWEVDVSDAQDDLLARIASRRLWQLLNLELRSRRGWSYGANYSVDVAGTRAVVRIAAEVQPDRAHEALGVFRAEIAGLHDGSRSLHAVADVRETLVQSMLLEGSTSAGLERALRADVAAGRSARFRSDVLRAAQALDAPTLEAARGTLLPSRVRVTLVADPSVLAAPQL